MKCMKSILFLMMISIVVAPVSALTLDDVNTAISETNASWSANYSGDHTFGNIEIPITTIEADKFFYDGRPIPDLYDLRDYNLVTPVKNQGPCGSCWAFGSIGAVETAIKKIYDLIVDLSEQQLVNCVYNGCNGGSPYDAIFYMGRTGIDLETAIPYIAYETTCSTPYGFEKRAWIIDHIYNAGYLSTTTDDVKAKTIQQGILDWGGCNICIDVNEDFLYYGSGIYEPLVGRTTNHAVVLVGWYWTGDPETSYWIIKNSWGTWWGDNGYAEISWYAGIHNGCTYTFIDRVRPYSSACDRYDTNSNGVITKCEVTKAVQDYYNDLVTKTDAVAVVNCYFEPLCTKYDIGNNGLSTDDVILALKDYGSGCLSREEFLEIFECYSP